MYSLTSLRIRLYHICPKFIRSICHFLYLTSHNYSQRDMNYYNLRDACSKKQWLQQCGTLMIKHWVIQMYLAWEQSTSDNRKRCAVTLTKESNSNQTFTMGINAFCNDLFSFTNLATTCPQHWQKQSNMFSPTRTY